MPNPTRVLAVLALAAIPATATAQVQQQGMTPLSAEALAQKIDSVVTADVMPRGFPSVSIVVTRGGRTVLERAWGVANVATGQRADANTTYRIGSVSKQFTAALVLRLVDRNRIQLTDSIGRYLTGLRPEFRPITIEQLLNHTSGLARDYMQVDRAALDLPADSLIAMASRDTLVTKPGQAFAYSNTGYMLLGALVEKVYGKSYGQALRDEIARPLGLTTLAWCGDAAATGRNAANGYTRTSDGRPTPPIAQHPSQALGAGSVCASARDMARWNQALHGGRVLSPASYAAMITPRGAAVQARYGFGLVARNAPWGRASIVHDGQSAGFSAHNGWYPADSMSVTLLYNGHPRMEVGMADFVANIAVGGTPRPIPPLPRIELPVAAQQGEGRPRFVGAYEISTGRVFMVTFENGALWVTPPGSSEKQQLFHRAGLVYTLGAADATTTVTFREEDGVVTGFVARQNGFDRELRKVK